MRIAIFLVYLCSLLLRLDGHIYADTQQKNIRYTLTRSFEKGQSEDDTLICTPDTDKDQDYIFDDDREDVEEDRFSAAGQQPIPYGSSSRPYQSILLYLYNSFKAPPSFYEPVSYIYIEQSVLRL